MNELLKLIGKKNTEKIISHSKFPEGIHELIRRGYVVVKDEHFFLTEKGENARKTGIQPEVIDKDFSQSRRNALNKSITESSTSSSNKKKSVLFIIYTFLIFFIKFLSNPKFFKAKQKTKTSGK